MATNRGFVIKSGDGEAVVVTTDQYEKMSATCDYFRNVFAHGTRESSDRILNKPDWSTTTVKQIIELACCGQTSVSDYSSYVHLCDAAAQILLELKDDPYALLPSCVQRPTGRTLVPVNVQTIHGILNNWPKTEKTCKVAFTMETGKKMHLNAWMTELQSFKVFVSDKNPSRINVRLKRPAVKRPGLNLPELNLLEELIDESNRGIFCMGPGFNSPQKKLTVFSNGQRSTGEVLHKVCSVFHEANPGTKRTFHLEEFSLRIPLSIVSAFGGNALKDAVERATNVRCYLHRGNSLGYYLDGSNDGVCLTFTGAPEQLQTALNALNEDAISTNQASRGNTGSHKIGVCSLRVCAPSPTTLDRLVSACCQCCRDNPGTLGVDIASNAFYAVKTVSDIKMILQHLASSGIASTFSATRVEVVDLVYPKGVF